MPYSLTQAAKAVGRTRQAIQGAIKSGRISAQKDELGRYQIDAAELHRVYPPVSSPLSSSESKTLTVADSELVNELRNRIRELQAEKEDWKEQARRWQEQAERMLPPGQDQRKGFFARLFGG